MMNDHYYGWGMGWGFPFMGPIFFFLIIFAVIFLIKYIFGNNTKQMDKNDINQEEYLKPLDVLKIRYARGDIDHETYERMKRELR